MHQLQQLLWHDNTASGRTIIFFIVALGLFGSVCAIRHCARYRDVERKWLVSVRDRLHRALAARQVLPGEDLEPTEVEPAAAATIDLHELAHGVPVTTLIGDRLRTIIQMKQARAKVNVDALQQSSILAESSKWTISFPGYVVSLVMMLGLLGTFIGLSMMVVDIQRALPGTDAGANAAQWADSVSGLGEILAGKKTAFSATLVGLFFSIVVSAFNFALARAQSNFYERLERFTSEELLPATIPSFDDETPWEKLSTQLGDSFEHLKALAGEQTRSAEQMVAVEKTFGTVIDNIEAITRRSATAPLQGVSGEITNVIGVMTQVNTAMIELTQRLPQILDTFRHTHQSTLREITTAMQAQHATLERVSGTLHQNSSGRGLSGLSLAAAGAAAVLLVVIVITRLV